MARQTSCSLGCTCITCSFPSPLPRAHSHPSWSVTSWNRRRNETVLTTLSLKDQRQARQPCRLAGDRRTKLNKSSPRRYVASVTWLQSAKSSVDGKSLNAAGDGGAGKLVRHQPLFISFQFHAHPFRCSPFFSKAVDRVFCRSGGDYGSL